jgi:histidine triad (HIT) family protein
MALGWRGLDALLFATGEGVERKYAEYFAKRVDASPRVWKITRKDLETCIRVYDRESEVIECIFCQIIRGEAPVDLVWDDLTSWVIRPLQPVVDEHVIVIPTNHQRDFATPYQGANFAPSVMQTACSYANQFPERDYNLITSKGVSATQSVFHLHIHLVPRVKGDGLKLPWSGQNFK